MCVWACVYDCSQVKLFSAVNPSSSFNSKGEYEALISLADALFCLRSFCFSVSRTLWGCWRAEFTLFSFFCLAFSLVNSFSLLLNFLTPHILFQCEFHFFFSFFFFQSVLLFPPSPFYLFIVGSISSFQSCKWCSYPFFPFGKRRNPHIRILLLLFCQCTSVQLGKTSLELLRSRKKKKSVFVPIVVSNSIPSFSCFFFPPLLSRRWLSSRLTWQAELNCAVYREYLVSLEFHELVKKRVFFFLLGSLLMIFFLKCVLFFFFWRGFYFIFFFFLGACC